MASWKKIYEMPRWLQVLLLAIVTLVIYLPVKECQFISYDDPAYVTENPHVRTGLNKEDFTRAFRLDTIEAANWHPVTMVSHMIDCELFGINPAAHHLMNLFFHILNVVLLYALVVQMTRQSWPALVAAALFALHPLNVESVAWIAERKNLLSTLLWILTTMAYVRYTRRRGLMNYLLIMVPFALGLMSKPMLVTLPCTLLLLDFWPLERWKADKKDMAKKFPKLILEKIPLFILAGLCSYMTVYTQHKVGAMSSASELPFLVRLGNSLVAYMTYLLKMVWPTNLAIFYPHPGASLPAWKAIVSAILLILIPVLIFRHMRRFPYLFTGGFWYLGTLVPVIGIVQVGAQAWADRYAYVPLIGIFIIIAWIARNWAIKGRNFAVPICGLLILWLISLSIATRIQLGHWKDSLTLFQHTLKVTKKNYLAHNNIGMEMMVLGKIDEAIHHYSNAIQYRSTFAEAYNNMGNALREKGEFEEALRYLRGAVDLKPGMAQAHGNIGLTLAKQNQHAEAIPYFQKAISLEPTYYLGYVSLGSSLIEVGEYEEAIRYLSQAIRIHPEYPEPYFNLGVALDRQGDFQTALTYFNKALEIKPDDAELYFNLGNVYQRKNDAKTAMEMYSKAIQLNPNHFQALNNLGSFLYQQGRTDEAIQYYHRALASRPDSVLYTNLGIILMNQKKHKEAIEHFQKALELQPNNNKAQQLLKLTVEKYLAEDAK